MQIELNLAPHRCTRHARRAQKRSLPPDPSTSDRGFNPSCGRRCLAHTRDRPLRMNTRRLRWNPERCVETAYPAMSLACCYRSIEALRTSRARAAATLATKPCVCVRQDSSDTLYSTLIALGELLRPAGRDERIRKAS